MTALSHPSVRTWQLVACSVRGTSHERTGTPNQDAAKSEILSNGSGVILAVADGHGSSLHERSDRGSRFAVDAAIEVLNNWIDSAGTHTDDAIRRSVSLLPGRLLKTWRERVKVDLKADPRVDDASNTARSPSDLIERTPEILYGSTLIAAVLTDRLALYIQIGDGDLLTVDRGGNVTRKVPTHSDLPTNVTESLCQEDADRRFRVEVAFFRQVQPTALVLLSTDGYCNSFSDDAAFLKVGRDLKKHLERNGLKWVAQNLEPWLKETTAVGSGDDLTLALAWAPGADDKEEKIKDKKVGPPWRLLLVAIAVVALLLPLPWVFSTWAAFSWGPKPIQHSLLFKSEGAVTSVVFSSNGKLIAAGGDKGPIIWDVETGSVLHTLDMGADRVQSVAISTNGKRVVAVGSHEVRAWDLGTGQLQRSMEITAGDGRAIAFSKVNTQMASSENNKIVLWDADTGQQLRRMEGHTGAVNSIVFSPDGKRIISGSDDKLIKIWDAETGTLLSDLAGNSGSVRAVAISANGKQIASGTEDGIGIWDLTNGTVLHSLEGQQGPVRAVAFSSDGKQMASDAGSMVILWDAERRELLRTLSGHTKPVTSVAFSPDGRWIASGSEDGTVKIWDLKSEPNSQGSWRNSGKAKGKS